VSAHKKDNPGGEPPAESIRAIKTRLDVIERQQRKDREEERSHDLSQLRVNRSVALFTGLLFVTSVVSDLFLIRQTSISKVSAEAAQKAANIADSSFKQEQRPYIVGYRTAFSDGVVPSPGVTIGVTANIHNIGHSPAIAASVWTRLVRFKAKQPRDVKDMLAFIDRQTAELTAEADKDSRDETSTTLQDVAPDASFFTSAELMDGPLSGEEMPKLNNGDLTLTFIGISRYRDRFGQQYETGLCSFYFGKNPQTWHFCPRHNVIQ
jgi:hypothetical protein